MTQAQKSIVDNRSTIDAKAMREGVLCHRVLSEAEAATIWALLNPTLPPSEPKEVRITLKLVGNARVRGWIIQAV